MTLKWDIEENKDGTWTPRGYSCANKQMAKELCEFLARNKPGQFRAVEKNPPA